ncbi:MAG: DUF4926 domain-containing protein [Leptolyngbya sp. BL-A-14]
MPTDALFHWVVLNQDVPDTVVKAGDRAVIVDRLPATAKQPEPGYVLEVFEQGETLDVVSVPSSWVTLLPEVWGQADGAPIEAS